jgi:pimeloyl-ACP methyl ester carboxylesterase
VRLSSPVDGFRLAYERDGTGPAVVLLHGWPGDHADYRDVVARLRDRADVVVPDLRGFGASDKGAGDYSAQGQARSVLGLIDELGLSAPVIAGYDVGSRVTQTIARLAPERVSAIVVCPPLPGVGERVLEPEAQREFWYQPFHRLGLAAELIDGRPEAVRAYLRHFWAHWSGPSYEPGEAELDRLTELYAAPGAFTASIEWYRAGSGTVAMALAEQPPPPAHRIAVPTRVLWPEHDPLFPPDWGDRLDEFFSDVGLRRLPGVGHFVPLEAPEEFAHTVTTILPQAAPDSR